MQLLIRNDLKNCILVKKISQSLPVKIVKHKDSYLKRNYKIKTKNISRFTEHISYMSEGRNV